MDKNVKMAPHESMELHELLNFKNICATKTATMTALVQDEELKTLMQQDLAKTQDHVRELQMLLQSASSS